MSALSNLAKMLGVPAHQAEDALHSERAARAVLSRRSLFAAGAALAAGSLLVGGPLPLHVFTDDTEWYVAHNLADAYDRREGWSGTTREDGGELEQVPARHLINIYWENGGIPPLDECGEETPLLALRPADWARINGPGLLCTTEY
jgi:hypothetical protein